MFPAAVDVAAVEDRDPDALLIPVLLPVLPLLLVGVEFERERASTADGGGVLRSGGGSLLLPSPAVDVLAVVVLVPVPVLPLL